MSPWKHSPKIYMALEYLCLSLDLKLWFRNKQEVVFNFQNLCAHIPFFQLIFEVYCVYHNKQDCRYIPLEYITCTLIIADIMRTRLKNKMSVDLCASQYDIGHTDIYLLQTLISPPKIFIPCWDCYLNSRKKWKEILKQLSINDPDGCLFALIWHRKIFPKVHFLSQE